MELLVLFAVVLVVYCGWLTILDELRTWRRWKQVVPVKKRRHPKASTRATLFSGYGRAGGGGGRWPAPVRGSA